MVSTWVECLWSTDHFYRTLDTRWEVFSRRQPPNIFFHKKKFLKIKFIQMVILIKYSYSAITWFCSNMFAEYFVEPRRIKDKLISFRLLHVVWCITYIVYSILYYQNSTLYVFMKAMLKGSWKIHIYLSMTSSSYNFSTLLVIAFVWIIYWTLTMTINRQNRCSWLKQFLYLTTKSILVTKYPTNNLWNDKKNSREPNLCLCNKISNQQFMEFPDNQFMFVQELISYLQVLSLGTPLPADYKFNSVARIHKWTILHYSPFKVYSIHSFIFS